MGICWYFVFSNGLTHIHRRKIDRIPANKTKLFWNWESKQLSKWIFFNADESTEMDYDEFLASLKTIFHKPNMKSDAIGLHNIPLCFIKMLFPVIGGVVTLIFNRSMMKSDFPNLWKSAKVLPVAKNFRSKTCSEYRPISILPALSEAFEIVLKNQIMEHVNVNTLLFEFQSGFRLGHSASTTMLDVTWIANECFEPQEVLFLVLLDFSKAFDTVDHNILVSKLICHFRKLQRHLLKAISVTGFSRFGSKVILHHLCL